MKKVVRKFDSSAESEKADREYYLRLTPEQRLEVFLELLARYWGQQSETAAGFERVYRVTKLGGR